jgi:peptidoglycan-associated lipoprotein
LGSLQQGSIVSFLIFLGNNYFLELVMRRFIFSLILLALLSACSTSVPIRDVPVYDKVGVSVDTKSALANSSVAPVNTIDTKSLQTMDLGPAGTGRVVYFDLDSYAIKSEYQSLIEANAKFLRANPARKVSIEGHTDERGGREYNLALGQKRADAVRKAFSLLGIPEAQLESISYGKEKPAAQGSDETAYSQNRRAEITYR